MGALGAPEARAGLDASRLGGFVLTFVSGVALLGGAGLLAVAALVVASVAGRSLIWAGLSAVPGDYELVEVGCAFSVFAFLGWAHLVRGHARITLVTDRLPRGLRFALALLADAVVAVLALFLAWRLAYGLLDKLTYSETTLILRLPLWWAYLGAMIGAASFVVSALYVLARTIHDGEGRRGAEGLAL